MPPSSTITLPANVVLPSSPEGLTRAADLLSKGALVALPTETVYGIALNLHSSEARAAAKKFKAPTPDSPLAPWVLHVPTPEAVLEWVPHISPMGKRLITKSLPGPVAFQIKLDPESLALAQHRLNPAGTADMDNPFRETIVDGYLTLRCPDFPATQEVLAKIPAPVAIIGAGNAATPAIHDAMDLPPSLFAPIDGQPPLLTAVVNGGPSRYRKSSTLVRLDGDAYSILRPGVIDSRIIDKFADLTILFICSGNTCRSPMAAALAAKWIADKLGITPSELPLRHIVVQSAGVHAARGSRAAFEAMDTVQAMGADLSTHFSQPATPELLRRADVIYTMTASHREDVLDLVPSVERKTSLLDPKGDIPDPIGSGLAAYQQVASRLQKVLQKRLVELPV